MTNKWKKYIEPIFDDIFEPDNLPIVVPRPEPKISSPSIHKTYPDPIGDMFRKIELPNIKEHQDEFIPEPPIHIEPLPGQRREGGKIIDKFDPEYPPSIHKTYPDPIGDMFRKIELPNIKEHQDEFIPEPPIHIKPLPGQRREGGKIIDKFDPEYPPIIIPRPEPKISPPSYTPPPDVPIYDLRPGEAFAQNSPFGAQQTPFGNRPFQPFQR